MKNQKGFTLIEMMLVMAIIGIVAAIAIPNIQDFKDRSKGMEPTYRVMSTFDIGMNRFQKICWEGKVFLLDGDGEMEQVMKQVDNGSTTPEICSMEVNRPVVSVPKEEPSYYD